MMLVSTNMRSVVVIVPTAEASATYSDSTADRETRDLLRDAHKNVVSIFVSTDSDVDFQLHASPGK